MPYYWLILTVLLLVLIGDRLIKTSRVGRAWEATREDEDAAELMGVPTFKYKLMAFALGAAIGGLSGSFYASSQSGYINPHSFPLLLSMLFVAAVVVGGSGNRWGAIAGGALVAYLPERFREFADYRLLFFGLALTVLAVWRPEGLLPPRRARRARAAEAEIEALEEGDLEEADASVHRRRRRSPLLQVDDATLRFGGLTALDNVSFEIREGEILGLIGPNGAGKTTCFNAMTGVYQLTSGTIRFDGTSLAGAQAPQDHPARAWPGRSRTSGCSRP